MSGQRLPCALLHQGTQPQIPPGHLQGVGYGPRGVLAVSSWLQSSNYSVQNVPCWSKLWCEVGACNHNKFPWAHWHWNTQLIPNYGVFFRTVPVLPRAGSPLAGACINSWLCLSFCLHLFCGPFFTTLLCIGFVPHCIPIFFFFHLSSLFF